MIFLSELKENAKGHFIELTEILLKNLNLSPHVQDSNHHGDYSCLLTGIEYMAWLEPDLSKMLYLLITQKEKEPPPRLRVQVAET